MISKLHNLFLGSVLVMSVCIGFSGTVIANEATECRRTSNLDFSQFLPSQQTILKRYFTQTITKRPKQSLYLDSSELRSARIYGTWTPVGDMWIADVISGKLFVRYKCNGKASYLDVSDIDVCRLAAERTAIGKRWSSVFEDHVSMAKRRGLTCGVGEAVTGEVASTTSTVTSSTATAPSVSSAAPQTPSASASKPSPVGDGSPPTISIASNSANGAQAKIEGRVFDEAGIAEVIIDGEAVGLGSDGSFTASFYVPRSGKTVEIVAFDTKGNKATKSLFLERGQMRQATGPSFASLNPSGKRVKPNQDALALIIGVADYERTPAKAAYADKDAQTFYDYAMLKLGIPASNIKELVNADANEAEVRLAVKDWIARSTKQGQSDVYVFFAGHGLANQSGNDMYLLPVDGEPRLLSDTAIARERLFADIAAANPRSVTVFLDTCYSGTTRGTDMLIASRPIAIRAKEQSIPEGFTVMTAAAGDQTAKPLEEAKHGMFSYFLMKGMEGDADTNQDNQITAGELHAYVQHNVIQQSSGSQTPELQGDADRVLIRFQ